MLEEDSFGEFFQRRSSFVVRKKADMESLIYKRKQADCLSDSQSSDEANRNEYRKK